MRRITVVTRPTVAEAAGGPLVSDSFNRPDNATSLGTTDTGQVWSALAGTWGIDTNQAYGPSGGDLLALLEAGASDVNITCDIKHHDNNGVLFRTVSQSDFLLARLSVNTVQLYRRQAGVWTLLADAAMTLTNGQTYAFRVVASGSTINVYVDGVNRVTATESFQSTVTKHGMFGGNSVSRWDNFRVDAA